MPYEAQLAETVHIHGHRGDRIDAYLARPVGGKTFEFHTYDDAGHAFFAVDRPNFRQHAALDGWKKVFGWFGKHLR